LKRRNTNVRFAIVKKPKLLGVITKMPNCDICGNVFPESKYAKNKKRCSVECQKQKHRIYNAIHKRKWSKTKDSTLGKLTHTGATSLADLTVVDVDGQTRVKGALALQRLISEGKTND
jgi:hypothetical protein